MRVALLGPYPTPDRVAGGVDTTMLALAEGLSAWPGVELHVITAGPGLRAGRSEPRPGLTLHTVPRHHLDRLTLYGRVVWPMVRILRQIAPDIAHAQMASYYGDAALRSGYPPVITLQGVVFREAALALAGSPPAVRLRWWIDTWYERRIVSRARDLIVTTPYAAQEYRGLTGARFHYIGNPVPDRFFEIPELRTHFGDRPPTVFCAARLIPRKDILTLLRAFARIRAALPSAELEIAGQTDVDPAYTARCREEIAGLGLGDSVRLLGNLAGDELTACYARADLVMLTSRQETAPLTVSEAMAAGRPVVATRVCGVPYMVVEGETGLLADVGDVEGLAGAAIALLGDGARRAAYGRAGRAVAEQQFRLKAVVARTLDVYDACREASRGGPGATDGRSSRAPSPARANAPGTGLLRGAIRKERGDR